MSSPQPHGGRGAHAPQRDTNPFPYSDSNKRYLTQDYYLRHRFGKKVVKLSLNAGFTCPNRDGTVGVGGCTYCSSRLSGDFAGDPHDDVPTQIAHQRDSLRSKWDDCLYIPYFQAGTNTYAPLDRLKALFEAALTPEGVVGLAVATRADCLPDATVDYLAELSKRTYLTVELGLQTVHDSTAEYIRRGHTFEQFLDAYGRLTAKGIGVCVHVIDGLPHETPDMMLETIRTVASLHPHSVKVHMLHVLKGTVAARQYLNGDYTLLSLEEYARLVCDQIELLPPDVVVQRITGDGAKDDLVAPLWTLKKFVVMNEVDKELVRRGSYQGLRYGSP